MVCGHSTQPKTSTESTIHPVSWLFRGLLVSRMSQDSVGLLGIADCLCLLQCTVHGTVAQQGAEECHVLRMRPTQHSHMRAQQRPWAARHFQIPASVYELTIWKILKTWCCDCHILFRSSTSFGMLISSDGTVSYMLFIGSHEREEKILEPQGNPDIKYSILECMRSVQVATQSTTAGLFLSKYTTTWHAIIAYISDMLSPPNGKGACCNICNCLLYQDAKPHSYRCSGTKGTYNCACLMGKWVHRWNHW